MKGQAFGLASREVAGKRGREIGISDLGSLKSEALVLRSAKSDKAKVPISEGKVSVDLPRVSGSEGT